MPLENLLAVLADLSIDAETYEIALAALRLQSLLKEYYNV